MCLFCMCLYLSIYILLIYSHAWSMHVNLSLFICGSVSLYTIYLFPQSLSYRLEKSMHNLLLHLSVRDILTNFWIPSVINDVLLIGVIYIFLPSYQAPFLPHAIFNNVYSSTPSLTALPFPPSLSSSSFHLGKLLTIGDNT